MIRPLGGLFYWTPDGGRAAQTNTWTGQKSYDELDQKAAFVAAGMMAAELGRNVLRLYMGGWCAKAPGSGAEENGFALENFDGDKDGYGGVDAGGGEDRRNRTPMIGAGDDFFADQAGVEDGN